MNESRLLQDIRNQEQSLARVLAHQSGKGHAALTESARLLQNGNVEFDECGLTLTGTNTFANQSAILEVMKTTTPQTVWQMQISGNYAYRAFRIPSLYPGVQW